MKSVLRRTSSLVAAVVLVLPMISVFTPQIASAIEPDPILIDSCDDLNAISADTESLAGNYKLTVDIDCATTADDNPNELEWVDGIVGGTLIPDDYPGVINNGYSGFEPIGDDVDPFTGTFDGNNKTISNLWIFRKATDYIGLFGEAQTATISDLNLVDSEIVGGENTGGLVGYASNTIISNVSITTGMTRAYLNYNGGGLVGSQYYDELIDHPSYISASDVTGGAVHGSGNIIGGVVGGLYGGAIQNSTTSADVDGGYSIGGAIGEMTAGSVSGVSVGVATVHGDFSEGLLAKSGDNIGGFVGYMLGGDISYSSTDAAVEGEGSSIGGFAGEIWENNVESTLSISNSLSTGNVAGLGTSLNDSSSVGGFAGSAGGQSVEISDSFATGVVTVAHTVDANTGYAVGGFSGNADCLATFSRSYATGAVIASTSDSVGGFAGVSACEGPGGTLNNIYATGIVTGNTKVGGLVGEGSIITIDKSFASGNVVGLNYVGGLVGYLTGPAWTEINTSRIDKSYASGSVTATGDGAGGLVGYSDGGSYADVYSRSSVTGNNRVGGLIGEADGGLRIQSAYVTGALTAAVPDYLNGMIGDTINVSEVASFYPSYFDQVTNGWITTDDDDVSLTTATAKDTNQMTTAANIATYETDAEIDSWNFDTVWEFIAGQNNDYPVFTWQDDPSGQPLCEQAAMTSTTGSIACEMQYDGDVSEVEPAEWTITRYRKAGVSEWTDLEWVNTSEGRRTFYDLEPDTSYELSVRVSNNVIDTFVVVEGTTLAADSDLDQDGVIDSTENDGPNNGDIDNDGTLDSDQASVTSLINPITGQYVAISTDSCPDSVNGASNNAVSIIPEPTDYKDTGYSYPAGVMGFTVACSLNPCCPCENNVLGVGSSGVYSTSSEYSIQCCPCGPPPDGPTSQDLETFTITQYWFGNYSAQDFIARKYNTVTRTYATIPGVAITDVTVGNEKAIKVVYSILDNGPLDEDQTVGAIKDPSGPALLSVGVPNTGFFK